MRTDMDSLDEPRAYGRRTFLTVTAAGLSSLFWAAPAWRAFGAVRQPLLNALPPALVPHGWRIYTVADSMPRFDPPTWRLSIDGLVERPRRARATQSCARCRRVEQVSTFHCVTGWSVKNVRWGGVRFHDLLAAAGRCPRRSALDVRLGRAALRRLPDARRRRSSPT